MGILCLSIPPLTHLFNHLRFREYSNIHINAMAPCIICSDLNVHGDSAWGCNKEQGHENILELCVRIMSTDLLDGSQDNVSYTSIVLETLSISVSVSSNGTSRMIVFEGEATASNYTEVSATLSNTHLVHSQLLSACTVNFNHSYS